MCSLILYEVRYTKVTAHSTIIWGSTRPGGKSFRGGTRIPINYCEAHAIMPKILGLLW